MCWWRTRTVCASLVVLLMFGAFARGESILQLHRASEPKSTKPRSPALSVTRDDEDSDGSRFVLGGKKKEQPLHVVSSKKKAAQPPIHLDEKHAKKVKLKTPKLPKKPLKTEPPKPISVQFAVEPTPMAPSATELTGATAVPAPNSLWAGLAMMAALGICRWYSARRSLGI